MRKRSKRAKRSIFLCLLCLLIVLPNSVLAELTTPENPADISGEQVGVDNSTATVEPTIPAVTAPDGSTVVTDPVADPAATLPAEADVNTTVPAPETTTDVVLPPSNNATEPAVTENPIKPDAAVADQVEDTMPEIGDVTFSPKNAHVGDTVKITANMIDGTAVDEKVVEMYADLWVPNMDWQFNDYQVVRMRFDADNNQWIGFFIVQETWNPGYWDAEINAKYTYEYYNDYMGDEDLEDYVWVDKGIQNAFNVLNDADSTPPQAIEVKANPNPVKAGEQVTFTATIEDVNNQSDVVYAHLGLDFYNSGYERIKNYEDEEYILLKYDSAQDKWVGTYNVPANIPDGTEVYYSVLAADESGNLIEESSFYDGDYNQQYFVVSNPDGDTTPPVLKNIIKPDNWDVFKVNVNMVDKIPVKAKVLDDNSGVKSVTANLYYMQWWAPTLAESDVKWDEGNKYHSIELSYNSDTGRWVGNFDLTVNDKAGYYVMVLSAEDNNGNSVEYGYDYRMVEVRNKDADFDAPVIEDFDLNGDPAKFGDEIKIQAKVTDEVEGLYSSGIHTVLAEVYMPSTGTVDHVYLTLNPVSGRYEGTYKVKQNDVYITITVSATDNAGNKSEEKTELVEIYNLDDYLPPYIDFVKYPPATMYWGQTAHFETKLVDEGTGIHSATITLINVLDAVNYNGNGPIATKDIDGDGPLDGLTPTKTINLTYNATKDVWEADWLIPQDGPTGLFLVNLTVFDNVGNRRDIINDGDFGKVPQTMVILPAVSGGTVTPVTPTPVSTTPVTAIPVSTTTTAATTATNQLPDTATDNFNILFAGLALIVIGGTTMIVRRKTEK